MRMPKGLRIRPTQDVIADALELLAVTTVEQLVGGQAGVGEGVHQCG